MIPGEITEGSVFESDGAMVRIKKYLNHGASANVFLAEWDRVGFEGKQIVVKAIRPDSATAFRSEFASETQTLKNIFRMWKERYPEYGQVVPELYGGEHTGDFPYILQEFINGKSLDKSMAEQSGNKFSEIDGLGIACQIGRLLDVLHKDLCKCYGDIKFNNFLVVRNDDSGSLSLKVIDWNVLTPFTYENVQNDLWYVSTYLFFILTGNSIKNENVFDRPENINELKNLSLGLQRFMRKALHNNSESRYPSAQDWLKDLTQLLDWWQEDAKALLSLAMETFETGEKDKDFIAVQQAELQADIAFRRGNQEAETLLEEISKWIGIGQTRGRLKSLLESRNGDEAARLFCSIENQEPYNNDEAIVLLGTLALAADGLKDSISPKISTLINGIELRLDNKWDEAYDKFLSVRHELTSSGEDFAEGRSGIAAIIALENEARLREMLSTDEKSRSDRLEILTQAIEIYDILPIQLQRLVQLSSDLPQLRKEAAEAWAHLEKAESLVNLAKNESDFSEIVGLITDALRLSFGEDAILTSLKEMIQGRLNKGAFEEAERLSLLPHLAGAQDPWFDHALKAIRETRALEEDFKNAGVTLQTGVELKMYFDKYVNLPGLGDLYFSKRYIKLVLDVFDVASQRNIFVVMKSLRDLAERIPGNDHQSIDKEMRQTRIKYRNDLCKSIDASLSRQPIRREDLDDAKLKLDLLQVDDEDRLDENVSALKARLETVKQEFDESKEVLEAQHTAYEKKSTALRQQLKAFRSKYELIEQVSELKFDDVRPSIQHEKGKILFGYLLALGDLSILQEVDKNEIEEWEAWGRSKIDASNLIILYVKIKNAISTKKHEMVDGIKSALVDGQLYVAEIMLSELTNDKIPLELNEEYKGLRAEYQQICEFKDWNKNLSVKGDDPLPWLFKNIPTVYWWRTEGNQWSACDYFEDKSQRKLEDFKLKDLQELAMARWVARWKWNDSVNRNGTTTWNNVLTAAVALEEALEKVKKFKSKEKQKDKEKEKDKMGCKPKGVSELKADLLDQIDNLGSFTEIQSLPKDFPATHKGIRKFLSNKFLIIFVALLGLVLLGAGWANGMFSPTIPQLQVFLGEVPEVTRIIEQTIVVTQKPTIVEQTVPPPPPPTSIPTSQYLVSDSSMINPEFPQGLGQQIRIEEDLIYTLNPVKSKQTNNHDEDTVNRGEIDNWSLDQPLTQSGYYELFFLDSAEDVVMNRPVSFTVLMGAQEVKPTAGLGTIDMTTKVTQATWRAFGIYHLEMGNGLTILMDDQTNTKLKETRITADGSTYSLGEKSLMAVKLPEDRSPSNPGQLLEQQNMEVVYMADDNQANFDSNDHWKISSNADSWYGKYHWIRVNNPISVKWNLSLPPGEFNLFMFVPSELSVGFKIKTMQDGVSVAEVLKDEKDLPSIREQKFVNLGIIKIDKEKFGAVEISMTSNYTAQPKKFACDAIVVGVPKAETR